MSPAKESKVHTTQNPRPTSLDVGSSMLNVGCSGTASHPTHGGLKDLDYSILQQCMHCGMCLPTCPTYDATKLERNSPRGRISLMRAIADAVTVPVIASGGVGSLDHLVAGVKEGHASAVLAASIFHFGTYTIAEAKAFMAAADIPVRL